MIFLVLEHFDREFVAKKKLCDYLFLQGHTVMIAPRFIIRILIRLCRFKHLLVLDKGAQDYCSKWFAYVKSKGGSLWVIEEEGWVPYDWSDFCRRRISKNTSGYIDKYLCTNKSQLEAVRKTFPLMNSVLSGHPRFDFQDFDKDANEDMLFEHLRSKSVVFASTFAMLSKGYDLERELRNEMGSQFDRAFYCKVKADMENKKRGFYRAFDWFLENGYEVSLRLHPAEALDDVPANRNYNILTQTGYWNNDMEADVIVHSGSTLAVDLHGSVQKSIALTEGVYLKEAWSYSDYFLSSTVDGGYQLVKNDAKTSAIPFDYSVFDQLEVTALSPAKIKLFNLIIPLGSKVFHLAGWVVTIFLGKYRREYAKRKKIFRAFGGTYAFVRPSIFDR